MTAITDHARLQRWFAEQTGWADAVLPDYRGGSIANIATSILQAFAIPRSYDDVLLPPLHADLLIPSGIEGPRVVVLIVIDGLSAGAYRREHEAGSIGSLHPTFTTTLTSVVPSTTVAALTSLNLGIAPARHGLAGYTLYLSGQRRVVNMVKFKPVDGGAFTRPAPDPTRLVHAPTIFARLAGAGIESVVVSHREYSGSPLSKIHFGDTPYRGHRTLSEFVALLRHSIETPGRRFVFGYWAGLDLLAHTWGPGSAEARFELSLLLRALDEGLVQPTRRTRSDVAVLLTSDHGQRDLPTGDAVEIATALREAGGLSHPPTGERRAIGVTLRRSENVPALRQAIAGHGVIVDVREALQAGLYGPAPAHPEIVDRVGDLLLLASASTSFLHSTRADKTPARGGHGSLTLEEMHVPLLVWRFD